LDQRRSGTSPVRTGKEGAHERAGREEGADDDGDVEGLRRVLVGVLRRNRRSRRMTGGHSAGSTSPLHGSTVTTSAAWFAATIFCRRATTPGATYHQTASYFWAR